MGADIIVIKCYGKDKESVITSMNCRLSYEYNIIAKIESETRKNQTEYFFQYNGSRYTVEWTQKRDDIKGELQFQ